MNDKCQLRSPFCLGQELCDYSLNSINACTERKNRAFLREITCNNEKLYIDISRYFAWRFYSVCIILCRCLFDPNNTINDLFSKLGSVSVFFHSIPTTTYVTSWLTYFLFTFLAPPTFVSTIYLSHCGSVKRPSVCLLL